MKENQIFTISALIIVIILSFITIRKIMRKKLVAAVVAKYGDIPGIEQKSNEVLKEMLASGGTGK